MNKKVLSAILFGALMLGSTGTFVSCKDYDDDIDNLQGQIDKLATKDDLKAEVATLNAALNTAKTEAANALTAANAAKTAAEAASKAAAAAGDTATKAAKDAEAAKAAAAASVAEAKLAAIEAAKKEIAGFEDRIKVLEANEANKAEFEKLRKEIAQAKADVEKNITGKIADWVTSVELVASYETGFVPVFTTFSTAFEQTNTFGPNGEMKFVKGVQVQTGDQFVVRVSPTNAVITPEMITLINSEGKQIPGLMVEKVERYKGLLTTRAAEPAKTGLWTITCKLSEYEKEAFNAATVVVKPGVNPEYILHAVSINNTLSTAELRQVVSTYDVAAEWEEFIAANELNFFVDKTHVKDINNRYQGTYAAAVNPSLPLGGKTTYKEQTWKGTAAVAGNKDNVIDTEDNRSALAVFPAVQGQAFKVSLTTGDADAAVVAPTNIKGMYVTLDYEANAIESAPSEWQAWTKAYTYTGLNKLVEGTSTEIIVNSTGAINDMIGFRVFAVNFDGTLVDPDGRAFYVNIGKTAEVVADAKTVVTPDAVQSLPTAVKSAEVATKIAKLTDAAKYEWVTDKVDGNALAFKATFLGKDGKTPVFTAGAASGDVDGGIKFEEITKVYTTPLIGVALTDWQKYEDGKAYNGKLVIKDAYGHVLATLNVSMTKELPTTLPADFSVKTSQLDANGVYNCYMIPDNWNATLGANGTMKMSEVFNFGEGTPAFYNITFAASVGDKKESTTVLGTGTLTIAKSFIDNSTKHATTVVYNYGKVSSKKNAKDAYDDVTITAQEFPTIYNCIYNATYTWSWATNDQMGGEWAKKDKGAYINKTPSTSLTYGTDYTMKDADGITDLAVEKAIYGASSRDGIYSALLSAPYKASLEIESATLTSDANGKEEYFKVTVTTNSILNFVANTQSSTTNPTAPVASTLTIKCKDMYNHDVIIKLPMTVNKR